MDKKIQELKDKHEKGEISQDTLTKKEKVEVAKLYDEEIHEAEQDIKSLDLEIEKSKNKLIQIIDNLKKKNNKDN